MIFDPTYTPLWIAVGTMCMLVLIVYRSVPRAENARYLKVIARHAKSPVE